MSIVENALKKLQNTKAVRPESAPPQAPAHVSAPRAAAAEVAEPAVQREAPRQPLVARSTKTIVVDTDALRLVGLMPPPHQERELAHQYRTLKRPLIRNAFEPGTAKPGPLGGSPRSIMVTSALPAEGKTFTSINLALSMSLEKDHRVLLVDGDVLKPRLSRALGIENEPGLLDALRDSSLPVESLVQNTTVSGLSILPVGHRSDMATELLASARMRHIVSTLEQLDPQGIVVFDSSPMLLTTEARVLSTIFGQLLLVVRASGTPQHAVKEALALVSEGPRIGLVLNQAPHEETGGYYSYGQYYSDAPADRAESDGPASGQS